MLAAKMLCAGALACVPACSGAATDGVAVSGTGGDGPAVQHGPLGTTLELTSSTRVDGAPSVVFGPFSIVGTGAFTVSNLRHLDHPIVGDPQVDDFYAIDVRIICQHRTLVVNPYFFILQAEGGLNLIADMSIAGDGLSVRRLTNGARESGSVYFRAPKSKAIVAVIYSAGLAGPELGRWAVPSG